MTQAEADLDSVVAVMGTVRWLSALALCVALCAALASQAWAQPRVMHRVKAAAPVDVLLTDGGHYVIWGVYETHEITVLDTRTQEQRVLQLPENCHGGRGPASAGLMGLDCETGPTYGIDLASGKWREFGAGLVNYELRNVGKTWVFGYAFRREPAKPLAVFENRVTGERVTVPSSSSYWDVDHLRPIRHTSPTCTLLGFIPRTVEEWLGSDGFTLGPCGKRARRLEPKTISMADVTGWTAAWATSCWNQPRADFVRRCSTPVVKAERFRTRRRFTWTVPGAQYDSIIREVTTVDGWVFAGRQAQVNTEGPSVLYKAKIPR